MASLPSGLKPLGPLVAQAARAARSSERYTGPPFVHAQLRTKRWRPRTAEQSDLNRLCELARTSMASQERDNINLPGAGARMHVSWASGLKVNQYSGNSLTTCTVQPL